MEKNLSKIPVLTYFSKERLPKGDVPFCHYKITQGENSISIIRSKKCEIANFRTLDKIVQEFFEELKKYFTEEEIKNLKVELLTRGIFKFSCTPEKGVLVSQYPTIGLVQHEKETVEVLVSQGIKAFTNA